MPIYLLHGFRWPRQSVRVHIILNNVDDAAPEWLMSPSSSAAMLDSLTVAHPEIMKNLPMLRFIEQYDPGDTSHGALSQPYVYVADKVEVSELSLSVGEVQAQGIPTAAWDALVGLRDHLAPGEKIGWWVVYCGDERREIAGREVEEEEVVVERMGEQKFRGQQGEESKKSKGALRKMFGKG